MKLKVITASVIAISLLLVSGYVFLDYKSKQEAKQNFILLCEDFVTKIPSSLSDLSTAEERSEINIPRAVINTALQDYIVDLTPIAKYDGATETIGLVKNATDVFAKYMKYKDIQALIVSRNPYRIELEAYERLLPYAAARSLYDKAYEKSFLSRAQEVERKFREYNSQTFQDEKVMEDMRIEFQSILDKINSKCAIAKGKKI